MSERCRETEALLSPYLDGELDADARRRVEAHVAGCDACRATLEEWRRADLALRSKRPVRSDVEWERLAQRVETAIDVEEGKARADAAAAVAATGARAAAPARGAARRWWLWSGSGALVAAALVALFWPWVVPRPSEPPTLQRGAESRGGSTSNEPAVEDARQSAGASKAEELRNEAAPVAPEATAEPDATSPVDARRVALAQRSPIGPALGASAPPEKKSRTDEIESSTSAAKLNEPARAAEGRQSFGADPSAGTVGLLSAETSDLAKQFAKEKEEQRAAQPTETAASEPVTPPAKTAPEPAARSDKAASAATPAPRSEKPAAAPKTSTESPWEGSTRSLVPADRGRSLDDGPRATPDTSFATARSNAKAALVDGGERVLRDAASEVDAFLAVFPQSPHRVDALAERMRLRARLAALDPDRWCEDARLAVDEWQRAAQDPPADLQDVAKDVDERCGGWGD